MRHLKKRCLVAGVCLGVFAGGGIAVNAQTTEADEIAALQKQNAALQKQLNNLETRMEDGTDSKEMVSTPKVTAAEAMIISGYVQTSYFDNLENPSGGQNAGYLWNTKNNNFSINKVKLTIASPPAERSPDKWDAGYRLSLLAGEDASILNSNSGTEGFQYLREAYVDMNIPIGNGLNVKAGDMISLLNYESGDGGAANENFSQGYQWYYTGDGPETGVQLDYDFTNWFNVKFRIEDSLYAGAVSSRSEKGFMGSLNFKPTKDFWFNLIGFGGLGVGNEDADGGEILAGYQITKQFGTGFEGDYFHLDAETGQSGELWSLGGWAWYDFTPQVGLAFRAEYLNDPNGAGLNVSSLNGEATAPPLRGGTSAISSPDQHGDLASLTLTLNYKPTPNIKIQPEIRYDTTSYAGGFDGKTDQVILGAGISYLY